MKSGDITRQFPKLSAFFGEWFNDDWMLDFERWEEVARACAIHDDGERVAAELARFLEVTRALADDEIGGAVGGLASLDPSAWGLTWREWLQKLLIELRSYDG